ncbi:MAG: hypothetical protein BWY06_01169 [Candidatus Latescibacteria bacterium ADurb.Bin168]|nr:MAG: hypothetical protein BWY06_01169 [Candidatus Latescibacteria bacterium ADurb.Bin168]
MTRAMAKKTAEASIGRSARWDHFTIAAPSFFPLNPRNGSARMVLTRTQKYACQKSLTFSGLPGTIVTGIAQVLKVRLKNGRKGAFTTRAKTVRIIQGESAAESDMLRSAVRSESVSMPRSITGFLRSTR